MTNTRPSTLKTGLAALTKCAAFYLVAGAVETTVFSVVRGGHADVPFTEFPGFLVLSPLVPVGLVQSLLEQFAALEFVSTLLFIVVFVSLWLVDARVRRNRRSG